MEVQQVQLEVEDCLVTNLLELEQAALHYSEEERVLQQPLG